MMKRFILPAVLVSSFILFIVIYLLALNKMYRNSPDEVSIKIVKGESLSSVAGKLQNSGVIYSKFFFSAAGRIFGYQDEIIPGEYKFGNGLTNFDVLKIITDASLTRSLTVTIPEGLNIRQIGRLISRLYGLDSAKFVEQASGDSLITDLDITAENLEGFLFPDIYNISYDVHGNTEKQLVITMVNQFKRKIIPDVLDEINKKKLTLKDIIIMASIIEGETRFEPEKKIISAVYYNRLKKRMRLEADPTVQYTLPEWKKRLTYSDLKFVSPYNTYLNRGLPPGPINNPGLSSIMAAINPDNNKFLYFVARGDGSHRFAATYDEHKKNIIEYKKYLQELENKKNDTLK
jgi:UPF0755 protein